MGDWHTGPLAGFDLETTSADPETARIVQAAVVARGDGSPADRVWLVNPGIPIPDEAAEVHGITTERVQAEGRPGPGPIAEIISVLGTVLRGCPLVIFNAAYDLTVLDREARRHGLKPLDLASAVIVDPHVLDKAADRYRKGSRKLDACCAHYKVTLDGAHDATFDALAAMRVAWRIATQYPHIAQMSGRDLMAYQAKARAQQAASLEEYFTRAGNPQHVNGDWPVQLERST